MASIDSRLTRLERAVRDGDQQAIERWLNEAEPGFAHAVRRAVEATNEPRRPTSAEIMRAVACNDRLLLALLDKAAQYVRAGENYAPDVPLVRYEQNGGALSPRVTPEGRTVTLFKCDLLNKGLDDPTLSDEIEDPQNDRNVQRLLELVAMAQDRTERAQRGDERVRKHE